MRGKVKEQESLFSFVSTESRVPKSHPLRRIKELVEPVLANLADKFEEMYSRTGRPSIPPEVLLKSMVLQCLYSIKSDRMFCETLNYNLLFRWFLNMGVDESVFDHSVFSKNRERLLDQEISRDFFEKTVEIALNKKLISSEHFSVDGTVIEAWASLKSFKKKEDSKGKNKNDPPPTSGSKNGSVDFRGEKRSNETHQSTTDPESRIFTKSKGSAAKPAFCGHAVMENREGLIVEVEITDAGNKVERDAAKEMLARMKVKGSPLNPKSLGADKGYHASEFSKHLKENNVKPHIAKKDNHRLAHVDGRTINSTSYKISQIKRKRIEEFFGWAKVNAGLRKIRFIGKAKTRQWMQIVASSYNLLRIVNLCANDA